MRHSWRVFWLAGLLELILVAHGHAQTNLQLWGNVTLDWVKTTSDNSIDIRLKRLF